VAYLHTVESSFSLQCPRFGPAQSPSIYLLLPLFYITSKVIGCYDCWIWRDESYGLMLQRGRPNLPAQHPRMRMHNVMRQIIQLSEFSTKKCLYTYFLTFPGYLSIFDTRIRFPPNSGTHMEILNFAPTGNLFRLLLFFKYFQLPSPTYFCVAVLRIRIFLYSTHIKIGWSE